MTDSQATKTNKFNFFLNYYLPVLLWAALIYYLSSAPTIKVTDFFIWDYLSKKVAHLFVYAVLFALILRATRFKWLLSFTLTMLYAASDEYHQSFVPGRSAAALDLGFDLSGANIAAYIIWKLRPNRPKKPKN